MPQESPDLSFNRIDAERQRPGARDRLLRQAVPLAHAWRGCLGLAMLLDEVGRTEYPTDRHALIPNACVTWMALRDVPRDPFAAGAKGRCEVRYASLARAQLRYGMPVIDFADALDEARNRPTSSGRHPPDLARRSHVAEPGGDEPSRRRAVLDRLSAVMTRFACCAVDARGRPLRRHWAAVRPRGWAACGPSLPDQWMPRAYLAFGREHAERVRDDAGTRGLAVEGDADVLLFPAERAGRVAAVLRPAGLWWDLQPCARHVDGQLEAAVFPPITLAAWDRLRFALPGDVLLDARIVGPPRSAAPTRRFGAAASVARSAHRPIPSPAVSLPLRPALSLAG